MRWSRDLSQQQIRWMEKLYHCDWLSPNDKGFISRTLQRGEYAEQGQTRLNDLAIRYQQHQRDEYENNI